MYLARGKNGKLGRQTRGHHVKGVGYDMRVADAPRTFRQRDVCVTNASLVRDQYDDQMGQERVKRAKARKAQSVMAKAAEIARRHAEGQAEARYRQSLRGKGLAARNNEILKNYFGRRANMGENQRTVRDLVNAGQAVEAKLSAIPQNGEYEIPINYARQNGEVFNPQLMCNTARPIPTPTSDYKINYEVPDTEFQKLLSSWGKDSRVDFDSQFPVGNPISRNGNSDNSSYGPSTDWDRFVYDTEQNVTRAAGGYDVNRHGGVVVGTTLLNRGAGEGMKYNGYGKTKKKLRNSGKQAARAQRALSGHPIQSNFGRRPGGHMGDWWNPTTWFDSEPELDIEDEFDEYDENSYTEEDLAREQEELRLEQEAYDRELAEYEAEQEAYEQELAEYEKNQEPAWYEKLWSGVVTGTGTGLQKGVEVVAQRELIEALSPDEQRRVQQTGLLPSGQPVAPGLVRGAPTNPITRAGASIGLTPTMSYAVLGGIGLTAAVLIWKATRD